MAGSTGASCSATARIVAVGEEAGRDADSSEEIPAPACTWRVERRCSADRDSHDGRALGSGAEETKSPPATAIAPAGETPAPRPTPPPAEPIARPQPTAKPVQPTRSEADAVSAKPTTPTRSTAMPTVVTAQLCTALRVWRCEAADSQVPPGPMFFYTQVNPQPPPRLSTAGIRAIACARPCSSASSPIPAPVTARTAATPSAVSALATGESSCGAQMAPCSTKSASQSGSQPRDHPKSGPQLGGPRARFDASLRDPRRARSDNLNGGVPPPRKIPFRRLTT